MTHMARGALVLAAALVAGCAVNPVSGKNELALVSESQEIQMGQQASQDVANTIGLYQDQRVQTYVSGLGKKLAAGTERPALPWEFHVVDDPAVNAFALPGGFIFVTRGLMTHINSEAELASVVGHEIGHVTARHSVQQISRAQVAQLGLGLGSILSSDVAKVAGVASTGLSLLFLKFSRDDESQADLLGFRYALAGGYDVREMLNLFRMLGRLSANSGGGKVPQWLETHPDPGNRLAVTQQRLDTLHTSLADKVVGRDPYLQIVDNMIYGENPRQGFFRGGLFLHPDLRFQLDFPSGWQTQNQTASVAAMSPAQDAIVQLTLAANKTPDAANSEFVGQQGIQVVQTTRASVNGSPAISTVFDAQTQQGTVRGRVTSFSYNGNAYQILGYSSAAKFSSYDGEFQRTTNSFRQLTDQAALNAQPKRVQLVRLPRAMTLEQFYQQYPSTVPVGEIALINNLNAGQTIAAGTTVKRVVG
ncbi:MAG TPA: M48 family metalloprotease [Gemmatimonadales bacterium]|nr:M48 family metalloprotease [Gemmatimonadales bacterium]